MDKAPKSRREIERLVLHELQASGGCEGAAGIAIVGCHSHFAQDANWTVMAFDAGTADDYACERALMTIVCRLQGFYELVQKH
jgi:hypothetical protein